MRKWRRFAKINEAYCVFITKKKSIYSFSLETWKKNDEKQIYYYYIKLIKFYFIFDSTICVLFSIDFQNNLKILQVSKIKQIQRNRDENWSWEQSSV